MFTSIVVGTDGSDTARVAVDRAADLARRYGARLLVVRAYQSRKAVAVGAAAGEVATAAVDADESAPLELQALVDEPHPFGMVVSSEARVGAAPDALIDAVEQHHADLLVVGCRGMQGARRLLGSVPNDVAHRAPCSVLVADTSPETFWPGPVVVGVDGSPTAVVALRRAARLAVALDQPLHIVSAYKPFDVSQLPLEVRSSATPSGVADALLADRASTALSLGVPEVITHPRTGDPADALVGISRAHRAAVVVVGNRGMQGPRRFLGSVPNKVAHHAPCSTLIVNSS